MVAEENQVN
uniref:Uncharacterized protein n=1 Tax=Arundo donax TaxID=35708 RepID=A0A0A9C143_ARUDO